MKLRISVLVLVASLGACEPSTVEATSIERIKEVCVSAGSNLFAPSSDSPIQNKARADSRDPESEGGKRADLTDWMSSIPLAKAFLGTDYFPRVPQPSQRTLFMGHLFGIQDFSPHLRFELRGTPWRLSFYFRVHASGPGVCSVLGLRSQATGQSVGLALQYGVKQGKRWGHIDNVLALYSRSQRDQAVSGRMGNIIAPSNRSRISYWDKTVYRCTLEYVPTDRRFSVRVSYPPAPRGRSSVAIAQVQDHNLVYSASTHLESSLKGGLYQFGMETISNMDWTSDESILNHTMDPQIQIWALHYEGLQLQKPEAVDPPPMESLRPILTRWTDALTTNQKAEILVRSYYLTRNLISIKPGTKVERIAYARRCLRLSVRHSFITGYLLENGRALGISRALLQQVFHHSTEDLSRLLSLYATMKKSPNHVRLARHMTNKLLIIRLVKASKNIEDWERPYEFYNSIFNGKGMDSQLGLKDPTQLSSIDDKFSAGAFSAFWTLAQDQGFDKNQLSEALQKALVPDPYYLPVLLFTSRLMDRLHVDTNVSDSRLRQAFFTVHLRLAHLYLLSGREKRSRLHMGRLTAKAPALSPDDARTLQLLKQVLDSK